MVWPSGYGMIYGMAWRSWHCICYGLAGITWYMARPGGHSIVYGMAWRGMSWCAERRSITYFKALPWAIVTYRRGVVDVSWRSCSHLRDPFTSRGPFTCIFRSHVQLLLTLGRDSRYRDCECIYRSLF